MKKPTQTLTLPQILATLHSHATELQQRYGIRRLAVFGSFARGEQRDDSDIDILVELGDQPLGMRYFSLVREIDNLFQRNTDVVALSAIKPRYFEAIKDDLHYV